MRISNLCAGCPVRPAHLREIHDRDTFGKDLREKDK